MWVYRQSEHIVSTKIRFILHASQEPLDAGLYETRLYYSQGDFIELFAPEG